MPSIQMLIVGVLLLLGLPLFIEQIVRWRNRLEDKLPGETTSWRRLLRTLMRRRLWIAVVYYQILIAVVTSVFYISEPAKIWRIQRNLTQAAGIKQVKVNISNRNAILTGHVATRKQFITASLQAEEVVGPANVINRLEIEERISLGRDNDALGEAHVIVDTAYDDSPQSLEKIRAIINLPQFESIRIRRTSPVAAVIAQQYGITQSQLPKSFAMLASRIGELNGLIRAVNLQPGAMKIPFLPRRHPVPIRRRNQSRQKPRLGFISLVSSGSKVPPEQIKIDQSLRPVGSSEVLVQIPFTRGAAQQMQSIDKTLRVSLLHSSMTVELGAGTTVDGFHPTLNDNDKAAIITALGKKKQRDVTLFILDAGWPDDDTYNSSLSELQGLVNRTRKYYELNDGDTGVQDGPPKKNMPANKMEPQKRKLSDVSKDPPPLHTVEIMHSLKEFTDLDKNNHVVVKIVYVPLSLRQQSEHILKELLSLYYFRRDVGDNKSLDTRVRDSYWKSAMASADSTLAGLRLPVPAIPDASTTTNSYNNTPGTTGNSYNEVWKTDSAIVAAIWSLADFDSSRTPAAKPPVYFVSESWTVLRDRVKLDPLDRTYGIVVAAVGNVRDFEVTQDNGVYFARWSRPPSNVLAALDATLGVDEASCNSSKIDEDHIDNIMAASFDGTVEEQSDKKEGVCGSSFSAPRIAWLLALSEAVNPTDSKDMIGWIEGVQQKLKASRNQEPTHQWQKLYLQPTKILH